MPCDYVKIVTRNFNLELLEDVLQFSKWVNVSENDEPIPVLVQGVEKRNSKNEIEYKTPYKYATFKGLEFRYYTTEKLEIRGSVFVYFNDGKHNYNDFTFTDLVKVLNDLEQHFNLILNDCYIRSIEFGVNITPPLLTNRIIDNSFLHVKKPFEHNKNRYEGKYWQVEHENYFIKLYNKALQYQNQGYKINKEILRFELKTKRLKKLKQHGINLKTLEDLKLIDYQKVKKMLLDEWQKILYFDDTIQHNSTRLLNYKNPKYWTDLIEHKSPSAYIKHTNQLKEYTALHSENIQSQISEIMSNKLDELIDGGVRITNLSIRVNETPQKNICNVTNLSISMQKEDSILLSHTGLKHYYQNDRKVFESIKSKYLSDTWRFSDLETQIKEIAHNIRNTKSNREIKQKRIYPSNQINLLAEFNVNSIKRTL